MLTQRYLNKTWREKIALAIQGIFVALYKFYDYFSSSLLIILLL